MKQKLLIISNKSDMARSIKSGLAGHYETVNAANWQTAGRFLMSRDFPVAVLDLDSPNPDEGFRLLESIPGLAPRTKIIAITRKNAKEDAMRAVSLGAFDFYMKPMAMNVFNFVLNRAIRISEMETAHRRLHEKDVKSGHMCGMVGISKVMTALFERIRKVSRTPYPVLVCGESGTGKEMVARAVHLSSPRAAASLVTIDCSAIPAGLMESELFGYEKGAFTGAVERKRGKLERAINGTVFLDEIDSLPLQTQGKMLRFLQEGTIQRIGATSGIDLDARIIAATRADLREAETAGRFRQDLLFRLDVLRLQIPPLRERLEDIPILAAHFARQEGMTQPETLLTPDFIAGLEAWHWPGNVRELRNYIIRAILDPEGIRPPSCSAGRNPAMQGKPFPTLRTAREKAERDTILQVFETPGCTVKQAAGILGISRSMLHNLMKKYRIRAKDRC